MPYANIFILILLVLIFIKWRKTRQTSQSKRFEEYYGEIFGEGQFPLLENHYTFQEVCEAYNNACSSHGKTINFNHFLKTLEKELETNYDSEIE